MEKSSFVEGIKRSAKKLFGPIEMGKPVRWIERLNKVEFEKPKIKKETKDKMRKLFRPDILETQRITGIDLSNWVGGG
jgi:hypothetical protein